MSTTPDLRLPSIDGLRAFDAAARLGSFERAADELAITASAVGKRIATLEDLLGVTLFARAAKPLALTAAGKEYLEQVRAALGLLAAMPQHRRAAQRSERLRVSSPPTFARQILVPRLEAYTRAQPQVELEVVLSIPYLGAAAAEADIEIRFGDPATPGALQLLHDEVLPVAAPSLLARLPAIDTPDDLCHATLLRTPLEPWAPWLRAAGLAWPEPASGPKLLDLGLLLEAAVSGQGVALARPSLAQAWLASGALIPLFAIRAVPPNQYLLLANSAGSAAAGFGAWLQRECAAIEAAQAERDSAAG
ncbi:MAG: LysR family transcriptional regulator [Ideonella sp.]|nr:LysR family transcriptional regulator [Ideonella sp.]